MKHLIRFCIILSLTFNSIAHALNPIDGFYAGGFGEISHGPISYLITLPGFIAPPVTPIARVKNSQVGGGGGAQLGYRLCNFRAEAEILFNWSSAQKLTVGSCNLVTPIAATPQEIITGGCAFEDNFAVLNTGFNGYTGALYGMFNGFIDFYRRDNCDRHVGPYIGAGIGGVRLQHFIKFFNTNPLIPAGNFVHASASVLTYAPAAQGIIGLNFFLDDFTWIGMDYRYLTTGNVRTRPSSIVTNPNSFLILNSPRYGLHTLNFLINFSFDQCS